MAANYPTDSKEFVAWRTAHFFQDGDLVNLGIGMPTKCLNYIPQDRDVWFQSENGVIGLTGAPKDGDPIDLDIVDAGGKPTTIRTGSCCFDSFTSFGYIRGGHVDATVLGAYEVDAEGNLANWMIPGSTAAGMGGAMDLVSGAKITIVMTMHNNKNGSPKIVQKTELPLTGKGVVNYIVTELCCLSVTPNGLKLFELAPGVTVDEVVSRTGAKLIIPENIRSMADCE